MLIIGVLICVVFVMIFQIIVNDFQSQANLPSFKNDSNMSLSNLLSDTLLDTWLSDSPGNEDLKVRFNQRSKNSFRGSERFDPHVNPKFYATYGYSNETKEHFLKSLLSLPSVEVKPDWSVVLGSFEHFGDDNWEDYLTKIGVPYLLRVLIASISETVTISRIHYDEKKHSKRIDTRSVRTELETNSADFQLRMETSFWPFSYDSQFRQGELILEHDIDGSDSLNTFFFTTPRLLIQEKIKDQMKTTIIRHFDEHGLNSTVMAIERMAIATRFLKRENS